MINGAHFLFYSTDADADRAFLSEMFNLEGVDAGGGWMIFKLPPAEIAVHPSEDAFVMGHAGRDLLGAVLYFMCDDVRRTVRGFCDLDVSIQIARAESGVKCVTPRLHVRAGSSRRDPSHRRRRGGRCDGKRIARGADCSGAGLARRRSWDLARAGPAGRGRHDGRLPRGGRRAWRARATRDRGAVTSHLVPRNIRA